MKLNLNFTAVCSRHERFNDEGEVQTHLLVFFHSQNILFQHPCWSAHLSTHFPWTGEIFYTRVMCINNCVETQTRPQLNGSVFACISCDAATSVQRTNVRMNGCFPYFHWNELPFPSIFCLFPSRRVFVLPVPFSCIWRLRFDILIKVVLIYCQIFVFWKHNPNCF